MWDALEQTELVAAPHAVHQLHQIGALHLVPFIGQAHDGVGRGRDLGVWRAGKPAAEDRYDLLSIHHDCATTLRLKTRLPDLGVPPVSEERQTRCQRGEPAWRRQSVCFAGISAVHSDRAEQPGI